MNRQAAFDRFDPASGNTFIFTANPDEPSALIDKPHLIVVLLLATRGHLSVAGLRLVTAVNSPRARFPG